MVLIRALGWLLLVLAVAIVVQDGLTWWSEGAFRLLALGDVWSRLDYGSLNSAESYLEGHVSSRVWAWIVLPVLRIPALPAFLVLGLALLWFGQGSAGRSEPRYIVSTRRPRRRRRSSGLS
jgi:hypothetical protein